MVFQNFLHNYGGFKTEYIGIFSYKVQGQEKTQRLLRNLGRTQRQRQPEEA